MRRALVVCTLAVAAAVPVGGHDKWEFGQAGGDDDADTVNSLAPGRGQAHDLEQDGVTPDEDWFRVAVRARQSYEVRASGSTVAFAIQAGPICQAQFCAVMTRVDDGGAALQQAVASEGEPRIPVLRWTASASGAEYVRVRGGGPPATWGPNDEYTIEMSNTTVFLPRFNNTATQTTVLIVQNTTWSRSTRPASPPSSGSPAAPASRTAGRTAPSWARPPRSSRRRGSRSTRRSPPPSASRPDRSSV
jgi:hypothetical protein